MCDYFLQRMEGDLQAGDLADIVRAGGAMPDAGDFFPSTATEWQLSAEPILFQPPRSSSGGAGPSASGAGGAGAGDALVDLLSGLPEYPFGGGDCPSSSAGAAHFFPAVPDAGLVKAGLVDAALGCGSGGETVLDMMKPILPRGVQMAAPGVSPQLTSPRTIRPYTAVGGDTVKLGVPVTSHGQAVGAPCSFDAVAGGLQMPTSPRAGGIKRRKNQARKVVCIPAPAAAGGGRTSGEVVPSDLWAWRKYGQKPIKGSPYPRGYYRCSSSKGCSARKQVERSRTDPNMLVITYTSEHNHPWPTQRNALAGSTRSHHAKNSSSNQLKPIIKAEAKDQATAGDVAGATTASTINTPPMAVKEEAVLVGSSEMERCVDGDASAMAVVGDHSDLMQMFSQIGYRTMVPDEIGHHDDDFFADLAELESDPMSLIFSKEYMENKQPADGDPHKENKTVSTEFDPFMLD